MPVRIAPVFKSVLELLYTDYTGCEKCRHSHEQKKVVTGQIPITGELAERLGGIHNLTPEKVNPFLNKNLDWRIQKVSASWALS